MRPFQDADTVHARSTSGTSAVPHALPRQDTADGPDRGHDELHLLGRFRLVLGGTPVAVNPAGQRLLALLALQGGHASRSAVAATLWPDSPAARAHSNLRSILYRLGRSLPGVVETSPTDVTLSRGLDVDVRCSQMKAVMLLNLATDGRRGGLVERVDWHMFAEDLLPGWDEEWLTDHQSRYRRLRLDALERLSQMMIERRLYGCAVQSSMTALEADPFRDAAHELLIRSYLAQGNRNDAHTHYRNYRRLIRDELGLDPPPSLDRLLWCDDPSVSGTTPRSDAA